MKAWLIRFVATYLIKNWRTTVAGVFGFVVTQFPQTRDWLVSHGYSIDALQGLVMLIIAFLAKDGGVSNAPAPSPAEPVPVEVYQQGG
jgi:hypothetical protein